MTIIVRYWRRKSSFEPDYNKQIEKEFVGDTARECMRQIHDYRYHHDLAKYTELEIINVED